MSLSVKIFWIAITISIICKVLDFAIRRNQ